MRWVEERVGSKGAEGIACKEESERGRAEPLAASGAGVQSHCC